MPTSNIQEYLQNQAMPASERLRLAYAAKKEESTDVPDSYAPHKREPPKGTRAGR